MQAITIDGQEHHAFYVERDQKGRCGIVTAKETFWLEPVCGLKGEAVEEWPKMPPKEIVALSLDEATAPKSFMRQLRLVWQAYRKQWMGSTAAEKRRLTGMWVGHDRYGNWIRRDCKTPDLSWQSFKNEWFHGRNLVVRAGMRARRLPDHQIERELTRIRYLAIYADTDETKIYLATCSPAAHSREEAHEVRTREKDAQGGSPSEPASAEAKRRPAYRIKFSGAKRWIISFGAHEAFVAMDHSIGRELAYILKHPHTEFHVLHVQNALAIPARLGVEETTGNALDAGLSPQYGTHLIERPKLTPERYREAREKLEEGLESARAVGNTVGVEEIQDKLHRLQTYQADAKHSEDDWAKACNDRFRVGLKRFKDAVAKDRTPGGKAFLEHLAKHLSFARHRIHYHPPKGFTWED